MSKIKLGPIILIFSIVFLLENPLAYSIGIFIAVLCLGFGVYIKIPNKSDESGEPDEPDESDEPDKK